MSLPEGYAIRRASTKDIDILAAHRRAMFVDMDIEMKRCWTRWKRSAMAGCWPRWNVGIFSVAGHGADQFIVAGTGLWLMDWIPHMIGSGRRGNILNVYTAAEFRRRGLAGELVKAALQWCRSNGVDVVVLTRSPNGRRLYESMGFAATNEMRIQL